MKILVKIFALMSWASISFAITANEEKMNLMQEALGEAFQSSYRGWSLTETSVDEGVTRVARYHDAKPAGEKWELQMVNGIAPSDVYAKKFYAEKQKEWQAKSGGREGMVHLFSNRFLMTVVNILTLEYLDEDDEVIEFSFQPVIPKAIRGEGEAPRDGTLIINKADNSLKEIRIFSTTPRQVGDATLVNSNEVFIFGTVEDPSDKTRKVFLETIFGMKSLVQADGMPKSMTITRHFTQYEKR